TLGFRSKVPLTGTSNFLTVPREFSILSELNLFRGGADWSALFAARAREAAQKANVEAAFLDVEAQAVQALVMAIQRKQEVKLRAEIVGHRSQLLKIAEQRYSRGYLPLQEVDKLSIDLSNAQTKLAYVE